MVSLLFLYWTQFSHSFSTVFCWLLATSTSATCPAICLFRSLSWNTLWGKNIALSLSLKHIVQRQWQKMYIPCETDEEIEITCCFILLWFHPSSVPTGHGTNARSYGCKAENKPEWGCQPTAGYTHTPFTYTCIPIGNLAIPVYLSMFLDWGCCRTWRKLHNDGKNMQSSQ